MPPTPGEDEGEGRAGEEDDVGRLDRERDTGERPGEDRLAVRPGLQRAHGQGRGDEDRHDRREVRLLREPERLRQDLVDPAVVVSLHEVRDRHEWSRDEHCSAPEPSEAPGETRTDVVHGERRDRAEHADLQDRRQREELDRARARDPRQRRHEKRPAVAREGPLDLALAEHPARGDEPDLVAALIRQPAVVVDREEQRDRGEYLDGDDHRERKSRVARQRVGGPPDRRQHGAGMRRGGRLAHPCARYQATVRAIPSRSGTAARNPNSSSARVVSSERRG